MAQGNDKHLFKDSQEAAFRRVVRSQIKRGPFTKGQRDALLAFINHWFQHRTSKGGMVQLTKALATAWAPDNIQVNCFLPGWINTDLTIQARKDVPDLHEHVLKRTPADRWGEINDMSGIAVFLASAASDFITGTAIPVDGGFSASI